jgi:hypothetical protein
MKETKADIIRAIKAKAGKASPAVRRVLLSGLNRQTKATLKSMLRRMRVTANGDIRL